jgi:hypothetical protein
MDIYYFPIANGNVITDTPEHRKWDFCSFFPATILGRVFDTTKGPLLPITSNLPCDLYFTVAVNRKKMSRKGLKKFRKTTGSALRIHFLVKMKSFIQLKL